MKKIRIVAISSLVIFAVGAFTIWLLNKRTWERGSAYLTFEGLVLDQYGLPVPGAEITAAFPYSRGYNWDGYDRGFRTEYERRYTDSSGHYLFNSKPRRHSYAEVWAMGAFDRDGNFLQLASHLTFRYDQKTGWNDASVNAYDEKLGWHFVEPKKAAPVILRVNRSAGLQQLAFVSNISVKGSVYGGEACFNAADGKIYPTTNEVCDFLIKISPCDSADGNSIEISSPHGGGVLWYDSSRMTELEAPPGDYLKISRLADIECPAGIPADVRGTIRQRPSFFFYSRSRQVYGIVRFDGIGNKKAASEPHFSGWADLVVVMNPRGERTLTSGFGTPDDTMPSLEFPVQIPYKDPWTIDYSKIDVVEDKGNKEVRVIGKPGAIMDTEYIWIMNGGPDHGEDEKSNDEHGNPDGSLDLKIKADLRGAIYLKIKFAPRDVYHGSSMFVYEPLNRIIKIKNELKNTGSASPK